MRWKFRKTFMCLLFSIKCNAPHKFQILIIVLSALYLKVRFVPKVLRPKALTWILCADNRDYCWNRVGVFLTLFIALLWRGRGEIKCLMKFNYKAVTLRALFSGHQRNFPTSLAQSPWNKMLCKLCGLLFTLKRRSRGSTQVRVTN